MKQTTILGNGRTWPMLIDLDKEECKRMLRRFELQAYANVMTALRAQGDLNLERRKILRDLADILSIPIERHKCEVRRVLNDERLYTIAYNISGPSVFQEWTIEGKRLIPLIPRVEPTSAFTALANKYAALETKRNASLPVPCYTRSLKIKPSNIITKKPASSVSETPAKKAKLHHDNESLKSSNTLNSVSQTNSTTVNSPQKRSKSQDSKDKQPKTVPVKVPTGQTTSLTPIKPVSTPINTISGVILKPDTTVITTATNSKKGSKILATPVKAGSTELLIKTHESEAHMSVPFSVNSSIVSTPTRRFISVSPSFSQGTKIASKPLNAHKNDLVQGHVQLSSSGNGATIQRSTSSASNTGNIITSIVNPNTLTQTIISGNTTAQESGKGNIVSIVPIGAVSQQRILHHNPGSGNSGQVLPQQVFVIPAGSTMTEMKNVTKVTTIPIQTNLNNVTGDASHIQSSATGTHHILQQPKASTSLPTQATYHQATPKIISIPLESTKQNFFPGKPKFTYGMKAMTSAKVQLPIQQHQQQASSQINENITEKNIPIQVPISLVGTTTTLSMQNNIPVTLTTLPVTVAPISITMATIPPASITSVPALSTTIIPSSVSVSGITTQPIKMTTIPVVTTGVHTSTVSPSPITVATLPVKPAITSVIQNENEINLTQNKLEEDVTKVLNEEK